MNRSVVSNPKKPIDPGKVQQLFHAAFSAHQAGDLDQAKSDYLRLLRILPADTETLYLLGTAYSQGEQFEEASRYLKKALKLDPKHPGALNNMGLTLKGLEKPAAALEYYRKALAIQPDYSDALSNVGNALESLGRYDEAMAPLRRALELEPDHADAHCNLGLALLGLDRFEEAAQQISRGLELRPGHAISHDYLGTIYKIWGRFEQALSCLNRAIELAPDSPGSHNNRGAILEELERFDEAMADFQRAAALNPDDTVARWNLAFLHLRQGMLGKGWEAYELRLLAGGQVAIRFPYPQWDGSSLEGKTVLVYAEQGLGDEIMFASCIPDLIARAGHCIIECAPRLATLFARSFPSATVVGADRMQVGWLVDMPPIDVQVPMGSLPRFLRPTLDSFPQHDGYLKPDPAQVEQWRDRIALLGPGLKIGICWRSGLVTGARHRNYSELRQWGEIFALPGVRFVNLQYGDCKAELDDARQRFGVEIAAFDDLDLRDQIDESAALMAALDLVITAPTAVLQTAGSVGVPSFALNSEAKPWNAFGRSDFMPWYPNMRLFNKAISRDWDTDLALVAQAAREIAEGKASAVTFLPLADGGEVAVSAAPGDLTSYVLQEQGKWIDPEYDFVLAQGAPQMSIVDVGAGAGAYAVPLARRVGAGRVVAVALGSDETALLMQSRMRNGIERALDVAFARDDVALDKLLEQRGLNDIGLVRLDRLASNIGVLERAERFFSLNSPLVMFAVGAGEQFDVAVPHWLKDQGYAIYRLVPGLSLLVPFTSTDDLDGYALNLFACKPDRAELLESDGKLVRHLHTLADLPGIDLPYWQQYLSVQPYAAPLVAGWAGSTGKDPDWEVYWMGLNLFAIAKSDAIPVAHRYACLQGAETVLVALLQEHPNLPRLVSLCRVLIELGKREMTVGILNQICDLLEAGMSWALDEPMLALSDEDAAVPDAGADPKWVLAMVLAQRENWRAFSTYFTAQESLPALLEVRELGYASAAVERKIGLITARAGQPG